MGIRWSVRINTDSLSPISLHAFKKQAKECLMSLLAAVFSQLGANEALTVLAIGVASPLDGFSSSSWPCSAAAVPGCMQEWMAVVYKRDATLFHGSCLSSKVCTGLSWALHFIWTRGVAVVVVAPESVGVGALSPAAAINSVITSLVIK